MNNDLQERKLAILVAHGFKQTEVEKMIEEFAEGVDAGQRAWRSFGGGHYSPRECGLPLRAVKRQA